MTAKVTPLRPTPSTEKLLGAAVTYAMSRGLRQPISMPMLGVAAWLREVIAHANQHPDTPLAKELLRLSWAFFGTHNP